MYEAVLDLPLVHVGKVRELYALPDDEGPVGDRGRGRLLMVATDNLSAFDYVLASPIPDKGVILTQLSQWWFAQLAADVENHVVSTDVPAAVTGRAVTCERLAMVPIECIARGYLTGSGWSAYQQAGSVCGVALPPGLQDGSRLAEPIFTPTTKAPLGQHDENLDFAGVVETVGEQVAEQIRNLTLALYGRAEALARERGLLLADTKFEFGVRGDGTVVLADEALTPDSSRYWDAGTWSPGSRLDSFDKQYVRNWLLQESGWDRAVGGAPPPLPAPVVEATRARYVEAYERLTGTPFAPHA